MPRLASLRRISWCNLLDPLDVLLDLGSGHAPTCSLGHLHGLGGLSDVLPQRACLDGLLEELVRLCLLVGGLGSLDLAAPAQAAGPFEALGGASVLAPSTLLGGS